MKIVSLTLTALLLALVSDVRAEVKLPALFADHMVLQRVRPLPICCWSDPGEEVTVRLDGMAA